MPKTVYKVKDNYELKFGGPEFFSILKWIKTVKGAEYNPTAKRWELPVTEENTNLLRAHGWQFIGDAFLKKIDPSKMKVFPPLKPLSLKSYDGSGDVLTPFQNEAVAFGISRGDRWLLALPPGTGKGVVGSAWLSLRARKALIICPAGMKVHWQRELAKWADFSSYIISGESIHELPFRKYDSFIINYAIVPYWYRSLLDQFDYIAVDECQALANPPQYKNGRRIKDSKVMRLVSSLCKRSSGALYISGTPGKDRPRKLFTVLNLIDPILFHDRMAFYNRYCDPKPGFGGITTYDGYTHEEELHRLISNYAYRKTKDEIKSDLPKKRRIVYLIDVDKSKKLLEAERALEEAEKQGKTGEEEKKEICYEAFLLKKEFIWEKIDSLLAASSDEKMIIPAYHTAVIDMIYERYRDIAVMIDGRVAPNKRQALVDEFQTNKKVRVLVGQMIAAGVGFTMTASSMMVFAEMWWMPDDLLQMEDRQHRMTSKSEFVTYIYCIAAGTKEEDMLESVNEKHRKMSLIMDGLEEEFFTDEMKEGV